MRRSFHFYLLIYKRNISIFINKSTAKLVVNKNKCSGFELTGGHVPNKYLLTFFCANLFGILFKRLVPTMFEELEEYRVIKKGDNPPEFESSFLFAYKDKLFYISGNGTVIEIDDYCAIGSGEC